MYPREGGQTTRLHYPFPDPSGESLDRWRSVRDALAVQFGAFVEALKAEQAVPAGVQSG